MASRLAGGLHITIKMLGSRLVDPTMVGVTPAKTLRKMVLLAAAATPLIAALSVALLFEGFHAIAVLVAVFWLATLLSPAIWSRVWGHLVDREVPALLAFILPYAPTGIHIADLIEEAAEGREFKWVRYEGERLKTLLRMGWDPERALSYIASTTRSKALSSVLSDYLHAQRLGASRSQLTLLLLRNSLEAVKSSWESYQSLVRGLGEIGVALTASLAAAAPIIYVASPQLLHAVPAIIAVSALALALVVLAFRPSLGEGRPPAPLFALAYASPIALMAVAAFKGPLEALVVGGLLALVVEVGALWQASREERALIMMKRAADNARYGVDYEEQLKQAEPVARQVVSAILRASKKAGKLGVGEALENTYRMIVEARARAQAIKGPAALLALVSALSPALAVYTLRFMHEAISGPGYVSLLPPVSVEYAIAMIVAAAPLVTLPASVMHRPWTPSLLPSLLALLGSYAALQAPLPGIS